MPQISHVECFLWSGAPDKSCASSGWDRLAPGTPSPHALAQGQQLNYQLLAVILLNLPHGRLLVGVNPSQELTMASVKVDPI